MLADVARVRNGEKLLCDLRQSTLGERGLAHERNRAGRQAAPEGAEHGPVILRLWGRNGRIRVTHDCGGYGAAFQHHVGLHAEERGAPDTQVSELAIFNRADIPGDAVSDRWVDRVFCNVAPCPEIV